MEWLCSLFVLAQQHPLATLVLLIALAVGLLWLTTGQAEAGRGDPQAAGTYTRRMRASAASARQRMRRRSTTFVRDVHNVLRR